jgi:hypothetical protein
MDETKFWNLIDTARKQGGAGVDKESAAEQDEILTDLLMALSPDDIIGFERLLLSKRAQANQWPLKGAAHLINRGSGEASFDNFRAWLIAQGRDVYEAALQNPDSLAQVATGKAEYPDILSSARDAYLRKTGEDLPVPQAQPGAQPVGQPWQEADLPRLFPKLAAKFR